jgi:RND superfamily putative drug exporter
VLIILIVLGVHLRSLILPLKALLTNALPVLAGLGAVVAFSWTQGGYVQSLTVLVMGTLLLAVSMDYEIFILSRVREAYDACRDHDEAIAAGMARAGRVVVGAAAVLLAVFLPYCFLDAPGLRELGVGLSVAILVDATIVRMVLVPSALALLADWNWWHPFKNVSP